MTVKEILKRIISEDYKEAKNLISEELYSRGNLAIEYIKENFANEIINFSGDR